MHYRLMLFSLAISFSLAAPVAAEGNVRIAEFKAYLFNSKTGSLSGDMSVAAFRGPVADRPHLQNWDDQGVSMAARLANLLNRSGAMRWNAIRGSYSSDLGFGGELYPVGSAAQIWNRQATVTVDMPSRARTAQAAQHGHQNQGLAPQPAAFGRASPATPANPTQADVLLKQQELRREFELADANWPNWTPR
jgi:hypothetical protein